MVTSVKPDSAQTIVAAKSSAERGDPELALRQFLNQIPRDSRLIVGYSGGMDSHVLLTALNVLRPEYEGLTVLAVHIDHGMQPLSASWARHCKSVCAELKIPLKTFHAEVKVDPAQGPEASARIARYELFMQVMQPGNYLLLAQHADDQVETFLLQALRGSGPNGLASIPRLRGFAQGWLCRPFLGVHRMELEAYARENALQWIEDPSNKNTDMDRNFLRHEIIPRLRQRWPGLNQTLSRSAARCGAASHLLINLAASDLEQVSVDQCRYLNIPRLLQIGQERIYNVLRLWVRKHNLNMPRLQDLQQVESDLLRAGEQSAGIVNVGSYQFRRYRDRLFLLLDPPNDRPFEHVWRSPYEPLHIPETGQTLTHAECVEQGLLLEVDHTVLVRSRKGGELIRLGNPPYHKAVKKVLQESRLPPWQRGSVPLVYVNDRLAAVWNIVVSVDFSFKTVQLADD